MFETTVIAGRILEGGLSPLLREVRTLDKLLCTTSPEVRHVLVRDGYLFPLHRRTLALCRQIASGLENLEQPPDTLARWLYLHNAEVAAALTNQIPALKSDTDV